MTTLERGERLELFAAAAALGPIVAAHRDALDQERRTPLPLVEAWRAAGFVRLWLPVELGGTEADPETVLGVVEAVAALDGAVAWNLLISISGALFAGYLPEATAHTIWGANPDCISAGSFMPTGRAVPVDDGYRVAGRWSFVSGVQHADWVAGNCLVFDGTQPRMGSDGAPEMRLMFLPAAVGTVLDTWQTGGLRGTGSHDLAIADAFVPEGFWFDVFTGRGRIPRPLYRLPFVTWFGPALAMLTLGIARHAIETLVDLAASKVPTGQQTSLRERPLAQIQVAQAEALVGAARAFLLQTAGEAWDRLVAGGEPTAGELARLRLANVHAAESAVRAVEVMYQAAGTSAIPSSSALDRCLRDVHVAAQHIAVSTQHYQVIGQTFLNRSGAPAV